MSTPLSHNIGHDSPDPCPKDFFSGDMVDADLYGYTPIELQAAFERIEAWWELWEADKAHSTLDMYGKLYSRIETHFAREDDIDDRLVQAVADLEHMEKADIPQAIVDEIRSYIMEEYDGY